MSTHESHTKNGSHALPIEDDTIPKAKELLARAARSLPAESPLTDKEKRALVPLMRITPAALSLFAAIYEEHADVVGGTFDVASVRDAILFEQTYRPLSAQAKALAQRIDEQVLVRRANAVRACFGLYQAMKGLARMEKGAILRPALKQISAEVKVVKRRGTAAEVAAPGGATAIADSLGTTAPTGIVPTGRE